MENIEAIIIFEKEKDCAEKDIKDCGLDCSNCKSYVSREDLIEAYRLAQEALGGSNENKRVAGN